MLDSKALWIVASRLPSLFGGSRLHRMALAANHAEAFGLAERLFEGAAAYYREDLEVEALARLRTQQWIARHRAGACRPRSDAVALEIERRLERLSYIESMAPPFENVPAHRLQASWAQTNTRRKRHPKDDLAKLESAA
jgi:hypothetical protein